MRRLFLISFLFILMPGYSHADVSEISERNIGSLLEELKVYLQENPLADDHYQGCRIGVRTAGMIDRPDQALLFLELEFNGLLASEEDQEQNIIRSGKTLAVLADKEGKPELTENVKTVFRERAASQPESGYAKALQLIENRLNKLKQGDVPILSGVTLDGKSISLEDYRGKVVLIDFWATWCGPCIAEIPTMKKVYESYHDQGFEIIGVSLDRKIEPLHAFIKNKEVAWPMLFDADQASSLAEKFDITTIPALYLLDREGRIVAMNPRGPALETAVKNQMKDSEQP